MTHTSNKEMFIDDAAKGREHVVKYLTDGKVFTIATIGEDGLPSSRPMSILALIDDKIVFSTSRDKDIYRELVANPACTIVGFIPKQGWMRIDTKVAEFADQAKADDLAKANFDEHYERYLSDDPAENVHFELVNPSCMYYAKPGGAIAL